MVGRIVVGVCVLAGYLGGGCEIGRGFEIERGFENKRERDCVTSGCNL